MVDWACGRRDSTHGTWVSPRALSWRRARCCRRTAAGNLVHVRDKASARGAMESRWGSGVERAGRTGRAPSRRVLACGCACACAGEEPALWPDYVRSAAWPDALGATGQEAVRVAGASTVCVEGASTEASTMRKPAGTRAAAAVVALVRAPVLCWVCSCSSLPACPWPTPRSSTSSLCACSCSVCVRWVCLRAAAGDGRAFLHPR